jgi:thiamine-phosphate pyrophosphorylase
MVDFTLYLITDRNQTCGRSLCDVVEMALRGGVRGVQLREKDLTSRELHRLAVELREATSRWGAKLLINDRIDIALAVDADGVHLGGGSMPLPAARNLLGSRKLIGVSCHGVREGVIAEREGADFITFGPVFHTASKAKYGEPVGPEKLRQAAETLNIPVIGLGGIKKHNAEEVLDCGARGIGLVSAVIAADDPEAEAAAFLSILGTSGRPTNGDLTLCRPSDRR